MSATHTLVIDDKFLVDGPDFALPGQIAERGHGHGLNVLRKWNSGGARVSCLSNGGAEEQVTKASQVGFFARFACGCG